MLPLEVKEAIEIEFWEKSEIECPSSDSLANILMKAAEARVFVEKLEKFNSLFSRAETVLEIGGGQCWASCVVKRLYPRVCVIGTDISPAAVASAHKWEHIFQVKIDGITACRSYATSFSDQSFDLVFAYAAAHHFVRHRRTLQELYRIIRPGGVALYLHEPACRPFMHAAAYHRVNAKRPEVPEDVLLYQRLEEFAEDAGLRTETVFAPTLTNRQPVQTVYFMVMQKLPFLQRILPTSVDMVFRKPL